MRKKLVKFLAATFVLAVLMVTGSTGPSEGDLPGPMGQPTIVQIN